MIAVNMDIKDYCENELYVYIYIYIYIYIYDHLFSNLRFSVYSHIIYTISSLKSQLLIRLWKMSIEACVYIFVVCVHIS